MIDCVLRGDNKRTSLVKVDNLKVIDECISPVIMDGVSMKVVDNNISLVIMNCVSVSENVETTSMNISKGTPAGVKFSKETLVDVMNHFGEMNDFLVCKDKSNGERSTGVIDGSLVYNRNRYIEYGGFCPEFHHVISSGMKDGSLVGSVRQ